MSFLHGCLKDTSAVTWQGSQLISEQDCTAVLLLHHMNARKHNFYLWITNYLSYCKSKSCKNNFQKRNKKNEGLLINHPWLSEEENEQRNLWSVLWCELVCTKCGSCGLHGGHWRGRRATAQASSGLCLSPLPHRQPCGKAASVLEDKVAELGISVACYRIHHN